VDGSVFSQGSCRAVLCLGVLSHACTLLLWCALDVRFFTSCADVSAFTRAHRSMLCVSFACGRVYNTLMKTREKNNTIHLYLVHQTSVGSDAFTFSLKNSLVLLILQQTIEPIESYYISADMSKQQFETQHNTYTFKNRNQ
jgi:hypothetical protein